MRNRRHGLPKLLAAGLGVGFSPVLPGTLASLLGLILYLFVSTSFFGYFTLIGILAFCGFWASQAALQTTEEKDPSWIVADEVLGMVIALFLVPTRVSFLVLGFILFRFFDSMKVFPINRLEKLKGVWGIFLDDVGAGVYTNIILHFLLTLTAS